MDDWDGASPWNGSLARDSGVSPQGPIGMWRNQVIAEAASSIAQVDGMRA